MTRTDTPNQPDAMIPILDLKAQLAPIREEIRQALDRVIDDVSFANGPAVAEFEASFAEYCGVAECVAVNTGTSALHLALRCLDVGPGDEVITVAMSFIATAWPILYTGATPVFVDIDERYHTLDPDRLAAAITPRTRAIIVVHLYGQCADMDPILAAAGAHNVPVIEDCAQAHGAEYKGRRAGAMGTLNCFSFYPSKVLGACGEGGGLTTNDRALADRARRLRDHAQRQRYEHDDVGYNYRMDSFQAAVLSVKLKYLDTWIQQRQAVAAAYDRLLAGIGIATPAVRPDARHVYYLYVVCDDARDDVQARLADRNIGTALHYAVPIHVQAPFRAFGCGQGDLPITERLARTCLSLPMYSELSSPQIEQVAEAIRSAKESR